MVKYRKLLQTEVNKLIDNRCISDNWDNIEVVDNFMTDNISDVTFVGNNRLGYFNQIIEIEDSIYRKSGLYNSHISNCEIEDNVFISGVSGILSSYIIETGVIIKDCEVIKTTKDATFGNGVIVEAVNESGGRKIPIFDKLTSNLAYILAMYRHDTQLYDSLVNIINNYSNNIKSNQGIIGSGSKLIKCYRIENIKIGQNAIIENVTTLKNGSINSTSDAPVRVTDNVIATDFIISSGSTISSGAQLKKTFIGQGCEIGAGFYSENSLFFANCQAFNGEACSVLAGPYTVTHHKSTLLIAGMFSFYNAGSGTNQSNHNYKLGPVHQGIFERGVKTGSFSYVLLPARAGAFSMIIGKHYSNFDTADLPFSYIMEKDGITYIVPGASFQNIGTYRDITKWPLRDKRKGKTLLDKITFGCLTPYTISKIDAGVNILLKIQNDNISTEQNYYNYSNCRISKSALKRALTIYERAIDIYIGELVSKLQKRTPQETISQSHRWVDLLGLYTPESKVQEILIDIKSGSIQNAEQLNIYIDKLYDNYEDYSLSWGKSFLENKLGQTFESLSSEQLTELIEKGKEAYTKMIEFMLIDAKSEYSITSKIGYGVFPEFTDADFENVRGTYDTDPVIITLNKEKH